MTEIVQFLKANPIQYLATVGTNGKAKCRPFKFIMEEGGKLWFCTGNTPRAYKDMKANPGVELCVLDEERKTLLRIKGNVVFEDNLRVKGVLLHDPMFQKIYDTARAPHLEVFYLTEAKATIGDFTGEVTHTYYC